MNPLDMSTPLDWILSYFFIIFLWFILCWPFIYCPNVLYMNFFASLGTLEEFSLEDFFPSFSFILLSSISSTSLLIPLVLHLARHWNYTIWSCLGVWSLFPFGGISYLCIYLLILKKYKKIIYLQKSKKIMYF